MTFKNKLRNILKPPQQDPKILIENQKRAAHQYWTEDRIASAIENFANSDAGVMRFNTRSLLMATEIAQYKNVLDFGGGYGLHSRLLSERYGQSQFSCYDIAYESVEELFVGLQKANPRQNLEFVKDYRPVLDQKPLIYCSEVFSHFSLQQLIEILELFHAKGCDVLISGNSFMKQESRFTKSEPRPPHFSHNFVGVLEKVGYAIDWKYSMQDLKHTDKRMAIIFARARK